MILVYLPVALSSPCFPGARGLPGRGLLIQRFCVASDFTDAKKWGNALLGMFRGFSGKL